MGGHNPEKLQWILFSPPQTYLPNPHGHLSSSPHSNPKDKCLSSPKVLPSSYFTTFKIRRRDWMHPQLRPVKKFFFPPAFGILVHDTYLLPLALGDNT